jgi:hypothetical protein
MATDAMWRFKMPELELDINYLVSCIDSINQISSIPAVAGLKEVVNRWVDEKTNEALTDPVVRLEIYSVWKKLSGDADSEIVVELVPNLPDHGLGGEVKQFVLERLNQQLDEAMKDPANKMLFFRSWLATSGGQAEVADEQPADLTATQPPDEGGSIATPPEQDEPHHIW